MQRWSTADKALAANCKAMFGGSVRVPLGAPGLCFSCAASVNLPPSIEDERKCSRCSQPLIAGWSNRQDLCPLCCEETMHCQRCLRPLLFSPTSTPFAWAPSFVKREIVMLHLVCGHFGVTRDARSLIVLALLRMYARENEVSLTLDQRHVRVHVAKERSSVFLHVTPLCNGEPLFIVSPCQNGQCWIGRGNKVYSSLPKRPSALPQPDQEVKQALPFMSVSWTPGYYYFARHFVVSNDHGEFLETFRVEI